MKYTEYGYFGRTQNVKDVPADAPAADAMAALFASLPVRRQPSAEILPFPAERSK